MDKKKKQFLTFLAVILVATFSWTYTHPLDASAPARLLNSYLSSSSRSKTLSEACGSETRERISQNQLSNHVSSVNMSVGIDGTSVIRLAAKVSFNAAKTKVQDNKGGYLQFILTFGVGLAVLLLSFPFMICCCTCNSCCPPKCCGRKPSGHKFQNYNMSCPLFTILALIIMAVAVSIYGLILVSQSGKAYRISSCAAAILTDDIMNGNVTTSGNSFFIGLNSFPSYLGYLRGNLSSIDGNLSDIHSSSSSSTMNQAISQSQTALADTIKISNNDASGSNLTLTYNTPIDSTTTSGTVSSIFPTVLGSYSSQTGLVWSLYSTIYKFDQFLSAFKANASNLHNNISVFSQGLSQAVTSANILKNDVNSDLNEANTFIENWSKQSQNYEPAILGYFIGSIGVMILCLIAAIFTYRGNKNCCRRFMYLNCFLMFFVCLIGFLLAVFSSCALPVYAWGCNYLDESISSQFNYQNNLNPWINISTLQQTGVCMPYGNGDIYTQVAGTTGAQQFDLLRGIFTTLTTFQLPTYIDPIYTSLTTTLTTVQSYGLGQLIDVNDATTVSVLEVLADYSKGSYTNCNSNTPADSWVPSNRPSPTSSTVIACTATNGNQGTALTCPSGLSSTSGGCSGCMDSSEILFRYLNPSYSLPTDLSLRYGSICSFNTKLNNVWTKYYRIKLTAIGPTVGSTSRPTGVYPRSKTVEADVNSLNSTVSPALTTTISTINSNLASISSLTDPTYGIFGSVNCKVIGQDAQRIRGTLCGTAFTHTYIMRIIVGSLSYILLLALFFIVLFGSRHARQVFEEQENATYYPHSGVNPYETNDEKNKQTPGTAWNNNGESAGNIAYL